MGDLYRARLTSPAFKATEPVRLEQYGLGDMRILGEGGKLLKGAVQAASGVGRTNSRGWVDASGDTEGVLLAGKNFWQNYPKAISASPEAFHCYLIPDRGRPFPVPRGMAKTHTFFLYFIRGREEPVAQSDLAYMVQRWPMPARHRSTTSRAESCGTTFLTTQVVSTARSRYPRDVRARQARRTLERLAGDGPTASSTTVISRSGRRTRNSTPMRRIPTT